MTPFARILHRVVDRTPGAIGGAFAASDGEMVDFVAKGDPTELAIITAHYGVILANLEALLDTQHFGGAQYFVIENSRFDVLVHTVLDGYYALIAMPPPAPLAVALDVLHAAAVELRREMR